MVSENERDRALDELKNISEGKDYLKENYVNVKDEFFPGPVDYLLGQFEKGEFEREEFYELSRDHQELFLDELARRYPTEKKSA